MIGIFLGEQNSGKTLAMTYIAKKYYNDGYTIYSNYNLNFPHTKITKDLLMEYTENRTQFNKAVFCIDEIYLILDSRSFGSKRNRMFSYFILQTAKRDVHLFGTAQYFNTVEKRFRDNCNFSVFCNRVMKQGNDYYLIEDNVRFLKDTKNLYIKLNFFFKKSVNSIYPIFKQKIFYLKAKPIFDLYDTTELLAID